MKEDNRSNLRNGAKSFSRLLKYMVSTNKVAWFFVVVVSFGITWWNAGV